MWFNQWSTISVSFSKLEISQFWVGRCVTSQLMDPKVYLSSKYCFPVNGHNNLFVFYFVSLWKPCIQFARHTTKIFMISNFISIVYKGRSVFESMCIHIKVKAVLINTHFFSLSIFFGKNIYVFIIYCDFFCGNHLWLSSIRW